MTWFRIDDTWGTHPKVQACTPKARLLWIYGGLYCAQHLTDGSIPKTSMSMLAGAASVPAKVATELVDVGLWIDHGDRYEVHDFLTYQPTRERVTNERAAAAARQQRARDRARESRRDEPVSNGPPDPTRPDPISTTNDHHQLSSVAAPVVVVERAIRIMVDNEMARALDRQFIEDEPAYRATVHRRIVNEWTDKLTTNATANPLIAPSDLVTLTFGDFEGAA